MALQGALRGFAGLVWGIVCVGLLTGSRSDEATGYAHHSSTFDIDERAMLNGLSVFMKILENEGVVEWN